MRQYSDAEWAEAIANVNPKKKKLIVVPEGFGVKGAHGKTQEYTRLEKEGIVITLEKLAGFMTCEQFDEIDCSAVEKLIVRAGACSMGQTELLVSMIPKFVNLVCMVVHFDKNETRLDLREFIGMRRLWVNTTGHCVLLPPLNLDGLTLTGKVTFTALPSSLTFFSADDVGQNFTIAEDNCFGRDGGMLTLTSRGGFTVRIPHTLSGHHFNVNGMRVERYGGYVSSEDEDDAKSDCTDIVVDEEELTPLEPSRCSACLTDGMIAGMAVYTCAHFICRDCVVKFRQRRGGYAREPRFEALQVCAQCRAEPPRVMRFQSSRLA